jgi:hypothetical protein
MKMDKYVLLEWHLEVLPKYDLPVIGLTSVIVINIYLNKMVIWLRLWSFYHLIQPY